VDGKKLYFLLTGYLLINLRRLILAWDDVLLWAIFGLTMVVGQDLWDKYYG
jgi:hypothetical protein